MTILHHPPLRKSRSTQWLPSCVSFFLSIGAVVCSAESREALLAQEELPKEIYQDFRRNMPLSPSFTLIGPDVDSSIKPDDEGLRITFDGTRERNVPVEVITTFSLTGDFEITGTFEFLSGSRPTKGYGVGIHLYVADTDARSKFAKICRIMHPSAGSVFLAEYWMKIPGKKEYQSPSQKSETKIGQLRLARNGSSLRFLASDGPDQEFREIYVQKNFGTEDMNLLRFGVADSGQPGNTVDARLVGLKIRMAATLPDKAIERAPLTAPLRVPAAPVPVITDPAIPSKTRLVALLLVGLGGTLVLAVSAGVWIYFRRRKSTGSDAQNNAAQLDPPTSISLQCPGCGTKLDVKAKYAGKNIKCPHCEAIIPVAKRDVPSDENKSV